MNVKRGVTVWRNSSAYITFEQRSECEPECVHMWCKTCSTVNFNLFFSALVFIKCTFDLIAFLFLLVNICLYVFVCLHHCSTQHWGLGVFLRLWVDVMCWRRRKLGHVLFPGLVPMLSCFYHTNMYTNKNTHTHKLWFFLVFFSSSLLKVWCEELTGIKLQLLMFLCSFTALNMTQQPPGFT